MRYFLTVLLLCLFSSCKSKVDYLKSELRSENGYFQAVIEIPAGTNSKIEYDKVDRIFKPSLRDGKERTIDFLAYPANYGFIPSTFSNPEKGGDGDALDVMVLSSTIPSGKIVEIIPIGMIKLMDAGEQDFKVIAIPADKGLRTISAENFKDFVKKYEPAKNILESWFLNYDPADDTKIQGWADEKETEQEILRLHGEL
ncbi:inorganic diphosphatase [Christiangramia sp. SM2212]|uniref:inorganic diphosphatase n=1 Tax=Christiangramia sediminicola TaxID=3073267 RepID=A0ABU1ETU5_9FLAO|nr:inorganic diphosphatase [Christiangramia sp. SM2212]MDR5591825.1 inorganic diphosphatase [Christiangramia sp. SM2212]